MTDGGRAKEATILSLSIELEALLWGLQNKLDDRFNKTAKKESLIEERPENPNVLDEILGNLQQNIQHLRDITAFVSAEVLPKIN